MPRRPFVSSLRWVALAWQGLVLVLVLTSFGAILHVRMKEALFTRVDSALQDHAHVLASSLEHDLIMGWELDVDPNLLNRITTDSWFEIVTSDGRFTRRGGLVPSEKSEAALGFQDLGDQREFRILGPERSIVRVGRSVSAERVELRRLLWFTIGVAILVLGCALLGGWWLATRTLRPIERMSTTASAISERELDRRIDPQSVPAELRGLATTLNAAFGRLEAAFARQARFTSDASHELRTPLAVLRAQAEHALRRERTVPEYREALVVCLRSTTRMTRIVEQLLALARADSGAIQIGHFDCSLDHIVQDAVEEVRAEALEAGVAIALSLNPVRVTGDAGLLHDVVSNLLSNAVRYNHPGGHVNVALHADDAWAVLVVEDDGEGIPSSALPHVFERFYRADPARSRERGGSGLGLSIVRWIVDAHEGQIAVESRLGAGTRFTVRVPLGQWSHSEPSGADST